MPDWVVISIVSFFTGITASLGLGGGFILLIYLTTFQHIPQLEAQGINLIFFIPIAILSLCIHKKNNLIEKKPLVPSMISGFIGVFGGVFLAGLIGSEWLYKLFAVLILYVGIRELFHKNKKIQQ
ncbi:MAG: putative rane protein [Oscillospiraceae bacterium]|jgi:uncharacterized membrane protein YfcA|nr:putative rane protein [Oscillospiraceae bacterium]